MLTCSFKGFKGTFLTHVVDFLNAKGLVSLCCLRDLFPAWADPARQHTKAEFQNIKGISKYFPLWHVDGHVSPSPKAAAAGRARRAGIEPGTRGL